MDLKSLLRWRDYVLRETRGAVGRDATLTLGMRAPIQGEVVLREFGADYYTFKEIVDEGVYKAVTDQLPACKTVIDLGANIGLASLYFASKYPGCRVCAVEPDEENFRLLSRNFQRLIDTDRGQVICAGLWSRDADLAVEATGIEGEFNAFTVREAAVNDSASSRVPGLCIQSILTASGFDSIDLLKVDVEGAERQLFQGDLGWLKRVNAIAIEFHDTSRMDCSFDRVMKYYDFNIVSDGHHTVLAIRDAH